MSTKRSCACRQTDLARKQGGGGGGSLTFDFPPLPPTLIGQGGGVWFALFSPNRPFPTYRTFWAEGLGEFIKWFFPLFFRYVQLFMEAFIIRQDVCQALRSWQFHFYTETIQRRKDNIAMPPIHLIHWTLDWQKLSCAFVNTTCIIFETNAFCLKMLIKANVDTGTRNPTNTQFQEISKFQSTLIFLNWWAL